MPDGYEIPGLNDSKQLSDKKRRELFPVIKEQAIAYGIAMVDEKTIVPRNVLVPGCHFARGDFLFR